MSGQGVTVIGTARRWIAANSFAPTWLYGRWRHPLIGYLVALAAQGIAIALVWLLVSIWPTFSFPALLPFLVITLVALNWGVGPGTWAMVVGLVLTERVVEAPWSVREPGDLVEAILFIVAGFVTTLVASQTERAHQDAHALAAREAETAALLDAVIEAMAEGVEVVDLRGRVLRANTRLRDLLALDRQADYAMRPVHERLNIWSARDERGAALTATESPAERVLRGETFTGAAAQGMRVRALDGRELEVSVSGAPVRDRQGRRVGGVLVISDVTERRRLERRTRDALGALLDMAESLVLTGADGAVSQSGGGAETPPGAARRLAELTRRVLGCRRVSIIAVDQATGLPRPFAVAGSETREEQVWSGHVAPSLRLEHFGLGAARAARLRAGEALTLGAAEVMDLGWLSPDGATGAVVAPMHIDTQLIGLLVIDDGAQTHEPLSYEPALLTVAAQLAAIVVERERLLRAQADAARLAELDRVRTDFIAAVSHDLQTPLTSIRAGLDLLNASVGAVLAPDERDLLLAVRRNVERLRVRVSALLTASQLDAGALRLDLARIDLRAVALAAVATVRPLFMEKGQTLDVDLPQPLPIVGDAHRLEEVLVNLLANAHRHTPAGTHVALTGWVEVHDVQVRVCDDGPGIPEEDLDAIFARFHRRGRAAGGSGLGLSISRSVVALHGGRLWAESRDGAGAAFHLTLPREGGEDIS